VGWDRDGWDSDGVFTYTYVLMYVLIYALIYIYICKRNYDYEEISGERVSCLPIQHNMVLLLDFAKEAICRFSALPHSLIPPSHCELIASKES